MSRPSPVPVAGLVLSLITGLIAGLAAESPASAAVGDEVIAWVEVESGTIAGGPGFNAGDHGNFSGTGSYTFRETGMTSTMSVTAPAAGTYPVWIRYAAGQLSAEENVTRSMGLLTNGGARQIVSYPLTGDWETWRVARAEVPLNAGPNTIAIACDRGTDFCRLNFDAIQVGGTAFDPCAATPTKPGWTPLFDGTFASFDGWRKAGGGGFGRQRDCTIASLRGRGATWFTSQQTAPYTLELDWRRSDAGDESSVYLASGSRGGADPTGGLRIPIGTGTGSIVPTGGSAKPADAAALAAALRPVGQWNRYRIELSGSRVRVLLNDRLVNTLSQGASATGFIGLENRGEGSDVTFRSIQLLPDIELGRLAAPLRRAQLPDGTVNPGGESTLGNLVAEAQRWATQTSAAARRADIAFVSPSALGADLLGTPGGSPATVTHKQVAATQPGSDTLVNMLLTGTQLETVLEQQWQRTADGTAPALVRLGASSGFTWTYDPTRPEGSRITGMWLGDTAITPTSKYSVTVSSSLGSGADNFREFADGTGRRTTTTSVATALGDYLETYAAGAPLAVDPSQRSVGVAFPSGFSSSYAAGGALAVDLTSWSYSTASDPKDTSVDVTVDGRPLGSFPVDSTVGADASDEQGRAAVRVSLPADLADGSATVRLVGNTTGTTVALPITVTGGRTPAPTSTPTPATAPAPAGTPSATPAPAKIDPKLTVKVRPTRVEAARTKARLAVAVVASGHTPTGRVTVRIGSKRRTATLEDGRATITLPRFARAGRVKVMISYAGDARTSSGSTTVRVRVRAAR